MQKKKIIILLLLIIMVLLLLSLFNKKDNASLPQVKVQSTQQTSVGTDVKAGKYSTQTNNDEGIEVVVKPKSVLEAGKNNVFEVTMNNHAISLDYDFAKISSLTDDSGEKYQAIEWKGSKGGHHVEGELIFPEIKKDVKTLELKIEGVASADRIFKWEMK